MGEGHLLVLVGLRLGEFESQRLCFMYPSPTGSHPPTPRPQAPNTAQSSWESGKGTPIQADLGGLPKNSRRLVINTLFSILQLRKLRQRRLCSSM